MRWWLLGLAAAVGLASSQAARPDAFQLDPAFRLGKRDAQELEGLPAKRQALEKILLRYGKRSGGSEALAEEGGPMARMRRDFRNCFFSPVQCYMRQNAIARRAALRR